MVFSHLTSFQATLYGDTRRVRFVGGSADGKVMDWPRDVPLPNWVRTGSDADDFYRVDESIGSPRYVHWSLVAKRGYGSADIPQEVRNCSPLLYEDTIGRFPVLTREKPDRQRRFELLIGGRLIGYFSTRELAEVVGRRLSTGGEL